MTPRRNNDRRSRHSGPQPPWGPTEIGRSSTAAQRRDRRDRPQERDSPHGEGTGAWNGFPGIHRCEISRPVCRSKYAGIFAGSGVGASRSSTEHVTDTGSAASPMARSYPWRSSPMTCDVRDDQGFVHTSADGSRCAFALARIKLSRTRNIPRSHPSQALVTISLGSSPTVRATVRSEPAPQGERCKKLRLIPDEGRRQCGRAERGALRRV